MSADNWARCPQLPRQWDAAVLSHPEALLCRAESWRQEANGRRYKHTCGWPIDPAASEIWAPDASASLGWRRLPGVRTVHPWCEAAPGPANVPQRAQELYRVRADNRQRVIREARDDV